MKKTLIAGAASVVMASCVGLAVALPAQAETLTLTTSTSSTSESGASTSGDRAGHGHGRGLDAALAIKLSLTETEIADAVSAVRDATESSTTRLDADATAEERKAARDARQAAFVTALADKLNLDEDTISAALSDIQAEKSAERSAAVTVALEVAVSDGTLTQTEADAVQKAVDAHVVRTLDEAVADGTLTQTEADAVQKAIDAKVLGTQGGRNGDHDGDRGHSER